MVGQGTPPRRSAAARSPRGRPTKPAPDTALEGASRAKGASQSDERRRSRAATTIERQSGDQAHTGRGRSRSSASSSVRTSPPLTPAMRASNSRLVPSPRSSSPRSRTTLTLPTSARLPSAPSPRTARRGAHLLRGAAASDRGRDRRSPRACAGRAPREPRLARPRRRPTPELLRPSPMAGARRGVDFALSPDAP